MNKFLSKLINNINYVCVSQIIDWLLDEEKFSDEFWDTKKTTNLTKGMKKIDGFDKRYYRHDARDKISFPDRPLTHFAIYMCNGSSESKDLIRHIRNGFAHGKIKLRTINKEKHLEIIDFAKSSNKDGSKTMSAYILVPNNYVVQLYKLYKRIRQQK